eukprot:9327645-Prorocentrum_lima.AAC.1
MTSSLVGSEMCIRDSPHALTPPPSPGGEDRKGIRGRCGKIPHHATANAVSYTHLTLPTICSV